MIPPSSPALLADTLARLTAPILLRGDAATAYRDPAALYVDGFFHLFFTLVQTEANGAVYMYVATTKSADLQNWTPVRPLTPRDSFLNFSSPGNIVRYEDRWILCLQTYPRPNGEKYGNNTSRLWVMETTDINDWSGASPRLLRVKGNDIPVSEMGRMIDPYLVQSPEEPGKWWCFYKQNGASASTSFDLQTWQYEGRVEAGENVCILPTTKAYGDDKSGFLMFHSPKNGIGIKRSRDLRDWEEVGFTTLGQSDWLWARGRITAGFVLDMTAEPCVGKYLMFFHGSGPDDEETFFDTQASLGLAWSDDLQNWDWYGKRETATTNAS